MANPVIVGNYLDDWIDVVMDWIGLDVVHMLVVWIGYVPHFSWTPFRLGSIHGIHVCVLLAQVCFRLCRTKTEFIRYDFGTTTREEEDISLEGQVVGRIPFDN